MIKKGMLLPDATTKRCRGHTFLTVFSSLVFLFLPFVLPRLLSSFHLILSSMVSKCFDMEAPFSAEVLDFSYLHRPRFPVSSFRLPMLCTAGCVKIVSLAWTQDLRSKISDPDPAKQMKTLLRFVHVL